MGLAARLRAWLAPRPFATTAYIASMVTLAYIATYGVRYPMFTLDLNNDLGGLTTKASARVSQQPRKAWRDWEHN